MNAAALFSLGASLRRHARTLVLGLIVSACAGVPARPLTLVPGDYAYTREYGSWLIRKEMKKNDVQGLSIALVDGDRLIWAEGFGYADSGRKTPATAETVYRVGSVSKLFTVTAALQLVEQGKLGLDRPLADYVPNFALRTRFPEGPPITLRSLMTHHAGLPSDFLKGMWTEKPGPIDDLPGLLRDEYAAFPPGMVFSYSNVGMTLLGVAVQNASGREFAAQLREALLAPLDMMHSTFSPGIDRSPLGAKAYKGSQEVAEPPLRDLPAGGLNSSAVDLSRFLRMILAEGRSGDRQVLGRDSVREMLRPQNADVPLDLGFRVGLGWALGGLGKINIQRAGPVAHHAGATLYHRAQIIVLPEAHLGVVALANTASGQSVVNTIATEVLKLALEAKTGVRQPGPEPVEAGPSLSAEELRSYQGCYATLAGVASVEPAGDHLTAKMMSRSFRLAPRADGRLQLQYRLLGFLPIDLGALGTYGLTKKTVAGHEILAASSGEVEMLVGEKVTVVPIPPAWRQRLGRYEITNAGSDTRLFDEVVLREADGLLLLDYALPEFGNPTITSVLRPVSDDEAVFVGLWRGTGETVHAVSGADGERVRYSGYELKQAPNPP